MNDCPAVLGEFRAGVQYNCDVADARHAGDYSLCTYLLKMREYYRWESGRGFVETLAAQEVGAWVSVREALWEGLREADFRSLDLAGLVVDPFESVRLNEALVPQGYVYSAGIGHNGRAHFFLGALLRHARHGDVDLYVAGHEYARDLAAPPAMSQGRVVFIRRDALRRLLWERIEQWRWNRPDNAMGRALVAWNFDEHDIESSLDRITDEELETALLHEEGEIEAGRALGEGWEAMLCALPRSRAEFLARAVRDHLADCLSTLPALIASGRSAALHSWTANFTGVRRQIFPALAAALEEWAGSGRSEPVRDVVARGATHWTQAGHAILDLRASIADDTRFMRRMTALVEGMTL